MTANDVGECLKTELVAFACLRLIAGSDNGQECKLEAEGLVVVHRRFDERLIVSRAAGEHRESRRDSCQHAADC